MSCVNISLKLNFQQVGEKKKTLKTEFFFFFLVKPRLAITACGGHRHINVFCAYLKVIRQQHHIVEEQKKRIRTHKWPSTENKEQKKKVNEGSMQNRILIRKRMNGFDARNL